MDDKLRSQSQNTGVDNQLHTGYTNRPAVVFHVNTADVEGIHGLPVFHIQSDYEKTMRRNDGGENLSGTPGKRSLLSAVFDQLCFLFLLLVSAWRPARDEWPTISTSEFGPDR